jgi:F-type H+-transporting ATPase subunit delta
MSESAVADRYARAIFALGEESGSLAMLTEHIKRFADEYAVSRELQTVFGHPVLDEKQREGLAGAIAGRLNLSPLATNALKLLARRRRLSAVKQISQRLMALSDEKRSVLRVTVRSAQPLSDEYFSQLSKAIAGATGRTIVLEKAVDPSLIAGVLTQIGDNTIDGTLRGRLRDYEQQLLSAS